MSAIATAGKVTQVLGPVIDVEFPPGGLPEVYTALKVTNPGISAEADNLTVEVAQQAIEGCRELLRGSCIDGQEEARPRPRGASAWE